ncbi:MAG: trehalose-phosphatase [Candidatus Krumholzibacteriales bacterium]
MKERQAGKLTSAIEEKDKIIERLNGGEAVIFLDYDGTLSPIVEDPSRAFLPEKTRHLLKGLSDHRTVVIMTGRGLEDVRNLVNLEGLIYAGSHGFNIEGPGGSFQREPGEELMGDLESAAKELEEAVRGLKGVRVERKPFALAVHYRQAGDEVLPELEKRVDSIASGYRSLTRTGGKKIFELRPSSDWNKGKAVLFLLDELFEEEDNPVPIYIGDDTTDEDAFRAISDVGIGIVVTEDDKKTAAGFRLKNSGEVADFLEELLKEAEKEASVDAWFLTYEGYNREGEKLREALCALGNGYFVTRSAAASSEAGEFHYPGTYVANLYNRLKSEVAGNTIENESLVNVPNWLPLNFSIEEGRWFDLDSVDVLEYRQELDMKRGVLNRRILFEDSKKRRTRLTERRFVHMSHRHLAGLELIILPENWSGSLRVRSALDGRVENTQVERYRDLNNQHLEQLGAGTSEDGLLWLQCRTNQSHIRIALAARTRIFQDGGRMEEKPEEGQEEGYACQDFDIEAREGSSVRVEKIAALYHSRNPALSESLLEAREALRHAGSFDELLRRHIISWSHLWDRWRIKVEARTPRIQQILNLHIFHLLQTVSPNTIGMDAGVPPRGLHGEAYRGLIMWDELFIFPLLSLRMPDITRALLMYRYNRLPRACWAAEDEGQAGAMFPWQSGSNGEEQAQTLHLNPQSGRWIPDNSQLQRHINIAVAYNVWQYYQVTGDRDFLSFYGAELMILISRFWTGMTQYNSSMDRYEILGIMGPDEFHDSYPESSEPGIDNNAYTNVMVAWVLRRTLDTLEILSGHRRATVMESMSVSEEEIERWEEISRKLRVPFHDEDIISQFEGYDELEEFDWKKYRAKYGDIHRLDRILESEGDSPNRYKLSKQADVLMLFYLLSADELSKVFEQLGYPFDPHTIPDNIEYYLKRTSHGSTLSRVVHAWVLARSEREMSWRLFRDALESDIEDVQGGTTREGIHLGAMAGTVDLILRCYSGMESRKNTLRFNPSLPSELKSMEFSIIYRRRRIDVEITPDHLRLHCLPDSEVPAKIGFRDQNFDLEPGEKKELEL